MLYKIERAPNFTEDTSTTGHIQCVVGLVCCKIMLEFSHTFIVCKILYKDLIIGLDCNKSTDWVVTGQKMVTCFYIKERLSS